MQPSSAVKVYIQTTDIILAMFRYFFTRIYYRTIKEVVKGEVYGSVRADYLRKRKRFEQALFAFYLCRAVYVLYLIANNFPQNFLWSVDYVAPFIRDNPSYDFLFFLSLMLMGIFIFIATQHLYVDRNNSSALEPWNFFYVLVVENIDAYHCCIRPPEEINDELLKKRKEFSKKLKYAKCAKWYSLISLIKRSSFLRHCYIRLRARLSLLYHLDYVDKRALSAQKLDIPLEIPLVLRIRLLRALLLIEKTIFAYHVGFCKLTFVFLFNKFSKTSFYNFISCPLLHCFCRPLTRIYWPFPSLPSSSGYRPRLCPLHLPNACQERRLLPALLHHFHHLRPQKCILSPSTETVYPPV